MPGDPIAFVRYGDYTYKSFRLVSHLEVPWLCKDDMMVCPELVLDGDHVRTVGWPVPFSVFSRFHRTVAEPRSRTRDTRSRRPADPEVLRLLQLEFPWLSLADLEKMLSKIALGGEGRHAQPSSSSGGQTPAAPALAENVVAAVSGHLEALREEVGHGAGDLYFSVRVLGGDWSVAR